MSVKMAFGCFAAWLSSIFGGWDMAIYALIMFIAIDYITGIINATKQKKLNPDIGFNGILKKFVVLLLIVVAHFLDMMFKLPDPFIRTAACYAFVFNEGISIVGNAAAIGIKVPVVIISAIDRIEHLTGEVKK